MTFLQSVLFIGIGVAGILATVIATTTDPIRKEVIASDVGRMCYAVLLGPIFLFILVPILLFLKQVVDGINEGKSDKRNTW
jgi:hypothetical protein